MAYINKDTIDLRRYKAAVKRYKWLYIATFVVLMSGSIFFALTREPKYEVWTSILIENESSSGGLSSLMSQAARMFSMGGGMDNTASAETYTIDVDAEGVTLYDVTGAEMEMPYVVPANGTVSFSVDLGDAEAVGTVINGKAIPLDRMYESVDGVYTITVDRDMEIEELRTVTVSNGLSASIYDFGGAVDASYAYNFDGYYSAVDYISSAGALWTTSDAWMVLTPGENGYVSIDDDAGVYLDRIVVPAWSDVSASSETLPSDYVTVDLQGEYTVSGYHVEGEMKVAAGEPVTLEFVSTDGPVVLTLTEGGRESNLPMSLDRTFVLEIEADSTVSYQHTIVR